MSAVQVRLPPPEEKEQESSIITEKVGMLDWKLQPKHLENCIRIDTQKQSRKKLFPSQVIKERSSYQELTVDT